MRLLARAACAAALFPAACGAGAGTSVTVERSDSAGVAIVVNRGPDVPLAWTLTPTLALGGVDEGPESFFAIDEHSVAADAAGKLYVLDNGNRRVVVFDAAGRHVGTLGRQGGGPGEFQRSPRGLQVDSAGVIHVYDAGRRGLVRFAPDGAPLAILRLEAVGRIGQFALTAAGTVVQAHVRAGDDGTGGLDVLATVSAEGDTTHVTAYPEAPMKPVEFDCVAIGGLPPLFAPQLSWSAAGRRIVAVASAAYALDVFDRGRHVARIRRDLAPRPASRELAIRAVGEKMEVRFGNGGSCVIQPEEVVEKQGYADVVPTIGGLAVAPDGTMWVQRYAIRDEAVPVDVFAPDGAYLGTLPRGTPLPAAFLPDGRVVAVERNELDVQRVVVYRVDRPVEREAGA